jgi:hypothetical protein
MTAFLAFSTLSYARNKDETDEVFLDPESLVRGLFEAITFEPGTLPDWDYVRSFFIPEAVFAVRKSRTFREVLDLDGYVEWWLQDIEKYDIKEKGFQESIEKIKMTVYRGIAQCFIVYKAKFMKPADDPGHRGLESYGLMKKEGRWWIVSVTHDVITLQNPLPDIFR